MRLTLFAALVFVATNIATAQKVDLREGYVVIKGDTIKGWLEYKGNRGSAQGCMFRRTKAESGRDYMASEVSAYGFKGGRYYESIKAPNVLGPVFGRVLTKGAIDLYRFEETFYVVKDDSVVNLPIPVTKAVVVRTDLGKETMASTDKKYVGILTYMMLDCVTSTENATYSESSITRIIKDYNKCRGVVTPDLNRKKAVEINFSAAGGYYLSTMTLDSLPSSVKFKSKSAFVGVGFEIGLPRIYDRATILFDIQYSKILYQGYNEKVLGGRQFRDDIIMKFDYLKFPVGLKYNFSIPGRTPFVKFGGYLTSVLKKEYRVIRETEVENNIVSTSGANPVRLRTARGLYIAAGYDYRLSNRLRTFLELRVDRGVGFYGTSIQPKSALINYGAVAGLIF
jgi:hypothetical protein